MTRLVQLKNGSKRCVALVEEPRLRVLADFASVHAIASAALDQKQTLSSIIAKQTGGESLSYDDIYNGRSEWKLLAPIDFPNEPARCLVSGTGLTHLGSAMNRQAMHAQTQNESDSMKMFRWGVEGGKPAPGAVGISPEWFHKGTGTILRAMNEPLDVPAYAEDGGEEAEIAGVYLIGPDSTPYRIGMAIGNEFSDHRYEKRNYLNLAGSKLRTCALGPELVIDPDFKSVSGKVSILRRENTVWSKPIQTGTDQMCHSLANLEHHHFKYEQHRRPGDLHVHYFGAHSLSFGDGIELIDGDVMQIEFEGFGRPLRNPLRKATGNDALIQVRPLT